MPVTSDPMFVPRWNLENLGSHNSRSIKDRSARLVSIDFSQLVLPAYQISLKSAILSYEFAKKLVGFIWNNCIPLSKISYNLRSRKEHQTNPAFYSELKTLK